MSKGRLSAEELSSFCSQAALMYSAGMTLYDGPDTQSGGQTDGPDGLIRELGRKAAETGSLCQAMKDDERWPAYMTGMVNIGERTGNLEKVMQGLSGFYEREGRLRQAVSSAVAYPVSLGLMLCAVIAVMLAVVLPVFRRVMQSMGVGMAENSSRLMTAGAVIGYTVLGLVLVCAAAVGVIVLRMKTGHKAETMAFLQKHIPPLRRLNRRLSASRVAGVLAMTVSGGYPMEEALELVPDVLSDAEAREKVEEMRSGIAGGEAFMDALEKTGLFDPLHEQLLRMAERAGRQEQVMERVAAQYEEQAQESISRLVSIIEPSLVALLAIVVGAILLAVMLPLAGILTGIL